MHTGTRRKFTRLTISLLALAAVIVVPEKVGATHTPTKNAGCTYTYDFYQNPASTYTLLFGNGTCTPPGEITHYYVRGLNRNPDRTGFRHYLGNTRPASAYAIYTSSEFLTTRTTHSARIHALYQGALRRTADSSGLNYWTAQLNGGLPWSSVVSAILTGAEYGNRLQYVNFSKGQLYNEAHWFNLGVWFEYFWAIRTNLRYSTDDIDPLDWSSDGCSAGSGVYLTHIDERVCRRHDFGWRNFGNGPTLDRTSAMKTAVDDRFLLDMTFRCDVRWTDAANNSICRSQAGAAHIAVRNAAW